MHSRLRCCHVSGHSKACCLRSVRWHYQTITMNACPISSPFLCHRRTNSNQGLRCLGHRRRSQQKGGLTSRPALQCSSGLSYPTRGSLGAASGPACCAQSPEGKTLGPKPTAPSSRDSLRSARPERRRRPKGLRLGAEARQASTGEQAGQSIHLHTKLL